MWRSHIGAQSRGSTPPPLGPQYHDRMLKHHCGQGLSSSRASTPGPHDRYEQPAYDPRNCGYYKQFQSVANASSEHKFQPGNNVCQAPYYQQFQPVADVETLSAAPQHPASHADTAQRRLAAPKQRPGEARHRNKKKRAENDSKHAQNQNQYAWSRVRTPSPEFWVGFRCSTEVPVMQSLQLPPQVTPPQSRPTGPTPISLADNVFQVAEPQQALGSMPLSSGHGVEVQLRSVKIDAMTQTDECGDMDNLEVPLGGILASEQSMDKKLDVNNPTKMLVLDGEENDYSTFSIGSKGHPHSCREPCKYRVKPRGCRDGAQCDHCHICRWRPSVDRLLRRLKNHAPPQQPVLQ